MTSAVTLRTPGTRGFLLYVKEHLPWVYQEYVKRGVAALVTPGSSGLGDADVTDTTGGTTYDYSNAVDIFNPQAPVSYAPQSPTVSGAPTADPASVAPTSAPSASLSSILTNIASAVGGVLLTKNQLNMQNTVLNAQLAQAKAGRPPLNLSGVNQLLQTAGPTVNFGLSPNTQQMLLWGGAILGGFLLLGSLAKGRSA